MFNLKNKPHNLLLISAAAVLITSFFSFGRTLDIHLKDTFFVIPATFLYWIITFLLLAFWTLYSMTYRLLLSIFLKWVHLLILVLSSFFVVVIALFASMPVNGLGGRPRRYYDFDSWPALFGYDFVARNIMLVLLALCVGLIIYFANLISGVIRKNSNGKKR